MLVSSITIKNKPNKTLESKMLSLHLFSENLESNQLHHIRICLRSATLYYQTNHWFVLIMSLSLQNLVSFLKKKEVVVFLFWYN